MPLTFPGLGQHVRRPDSNELKPPTAEGGLSPREERKAALEKAHAMALTIVGPNSHKWRSHTMEVALTMPIPPKGILVIKKTQTWSDARVKSAAGDLFETDGKWPSIGNLVDTVLVQPNEVAAVRALLDLGSEMLKALRVLPPDSRWGAYRTKRSEAGTGYDRHQPVTTSRCSFTIREPQASSQT